MEQFEMIAKTFQGLEEVLARELEELGATDIEIGRRAVSFRGDKEMMYRANFCLRTAVRVLKPIAHFEAGDADAVYDAVKAIDWTNYLDLDTSFAVDAVVYSQTFRHSKFLSYKVKDAIADFFRERTGKRPNISVTSPDIRLNIHVAETDCTLSLDSSGDSLHLRGYRVATCAAPLNEVLAAGLVKLSGWDMQSTLIDPFCGSGTIAIEAALMARNIYPGIFRKEFGFEKWKDFDRDLLDRIYNDDSAERPFDHKIYASDINLPTLEGAMANAKSAGVSDIIEFTQKDFRQFEQPEMPATIITNPPYGARLTPPDLLGLYKTIGERLKNAFKGGEAWVISSRYEIFDNIGLRPSVKLPLYNGSIECEFRKYVVFDGKMQDFRKEGGIVKTDEDRRRMREKKHFAPRHREEQSREDFDDAFEGDAEEARRFARLQSKHEEFERTYRRRNETRQEGGRERSERRSGFGGDRRNGHFGQKGGRRKPFGGGRRRNFEDEAQD